MMVWVVMYVVEDVGKSWSRRVLPKGLALVASVDAEVNQYANIHILS